MEPLLEGSCLILDDEGREEGVNGVGLGFMFERFILYIFLKGVIMVYIERYYYYYLYYEIYMIIRV